MPPGDPRPEIVNYKAAPRPSAVGWLPRHSEQEFGAGLWGFVDVAYRSKAAPTLSKRNVRFASESRHGSALMGGPQWANRRHKPRRWHCPSQHNLTGCMASRLIRGTPVPVDS